MTEFSREPPTTAAPRAPSARPLLHSEQPVGRGAATHANVMKCSNNRIFVRKQTTSGWTLARIVFTSPDVNIRYIFTHRRANGRKRARVQLLSVPGRGVRANLRFVIRAPSRRTRQPVPNFFFACFSPILRLFRLNASACRFDAPNGLRFTYERDKLVKRI